MYNARQFEWNKVFAENAIMINIVHNVIASDIVNHNI